MSCDTLQGLRRRCRGDGLRGPAGSRRSHKAAFERNRIGCLAVEGDGPVRVGALPALIASRVVRDSWNPVRIRPDRGVSLNMFMRPIADSTVREW